jgi:tetratricopeptide (TPR) repeat protein
MKYVFFSLIPLFLLSAGCKPDSPETLAMRAEQNYAAGHYSKAIANYEAILNQTGESPITCYNLALAAFQTQDYSYTIKMLEKAIAAGAPTALADACYELLGLVAEREKDLARAATYYRKTLNSPDVDLRVRVLSRLANVYTKQEHYDAALALLLTAVELKPMNAVTLYNFGMLCRHEAVNLHHTALDSFRQAERLLPENSPKLKETKNQVKRLEGYLTSLKELPGISGNAAACEKALAEMRKAEKQKNYKSAERHARTASEADPSNHTAALELARLCTKNKNSANALKAYDTALATRPNLSEPRYEAAKLAYAAKKYKEAGDYLRPALVISPRNSNMADLMGRILYAQHQRTNAKQWFERYLRLNPKAADSYREWVQKLPEA